MAKRIVTKIGNVFCAEIDGRYKCFFQYIMNDITQLNSSVIRVFKRRYPMDYKPRIEEIVSDEVWFYAHTILRFGIVYDAWYKVGNSKNLGEEECRKVLFGSTHNIRTGTDIRIIEYVDPLENWSIWHIGEDQVFIGKLPEMYFDKIEEGGVIPYCSIVERMKYGFYTFNSTINRMRNRIPLPCADIYVKKGYDDYSTLTYFYFHGNDVVRLVEIVDGKAIRMTSDDLAANNHKMHGVKFSDIRWYYKDFISEEEFEEVWNGNAANKPYCLDIVEL